VVQQLGRELGATEAGTDDDDALRRAAFSAYPDRLARRRTAGSDQFLLASGTGATLSRGSSIHRAEFLVALDLGTQRDGTALIRAASAVDADWIVPTHEERTHVLTDDGRVRATARRYYGAIVLREATVPADPAEGEKVIAQELRRQVESDELQQFVRRAKFAGVELDWEELTRSAAIGRTSLRDLRLLDAIPYELNRTIDREAPASIAVPSGRRARLDYNEDGSVQMSVKLQELFGLSATPLIGPRRVPLTILLLSPGGRPVQTTRDLASFWQNTYPEVRKELRGRYPRHPWPEDPTTATPTAKTKRR
jgi:ATP-dependent helicase HrpB